MPGRRSSGGVALLALLLAGACTQSRVDPNANVTIAGTLGRASGGSVAHARVALTKGPDIGEALFTFTTLGTRCLVREPIPRACPGARVTSTDARGVFAYRVKGRDTQGTFGNASTLEITSNLDRATGESEGPTATIRFLVQTTELQLPIRFWESNVTLEGDPKTATARWTDPPTSLLPASASHVSLHASLVFLRRDGEAVWVFPEARSGTTLDARLLEDSTGTVSVDASARSIKVNPQTGTEIDLAWSTGRFPYASVAGPPASRGKPCYAYDASGNAVSQGACRLTDGDYHTRFEPRTATCPSSSACPSTRHDRAYVDLGAVVPVTLVAVRGCSQTCDVETSSDARTWRLVGSGSGAGGAGDVAVPLASAVRARYVSVTDSNDVDELAEVSVWDASAPRATQPGTLLVPAPVPSAHAQSGTSNAVSLAAWIAIAALVLAALALVVALSRRNPAQ